MTASKYEAGTKIAFIDQHTRAVVEDEIWLVRKGYYHMPSDEYLHDENIIGAVIDGKRVLNDLFKQERENAIMRANQELGTATQWSRLGVEWPCPTSAEVSANSKG